MTTTNLDRCGHGAGWGVDDESDEGEEPMILDKRQRAARNRMLTILRGMQETTYYLMNEFRLEGWEEDITDGLYHINEQIEATANNLASAIEATT